jgi:hypothetical protein
MVIEEHRGNRRKQTGGGCDERLGNTGTDHREVGCPGIADLLERVENPPHRAEQADERCRARDRGKKRHLLFQLVNLDSGCPQQSPVNSRETLEHRTRRRRPGIARRRGGQPELGVDLSVARLEDAD